jgi:hypothetical protein
MNAHSVRRDERRIDRVLARGDQNVSVVRKGREGIGEARRITRRS